MSNPAGSTSFHLVIRLQPAAPSCAVKQVQKKGDEAALVLRIKDASQSLSRAEPAPQQVCMLVDLSTREFWQTRCLREIAYAELLTDVMPKLGIPNCTLLDPKFVSLQHSEKKTRVKELCESVGAVKQAMATFKMKMVSVPDVWDKDYFWNSIAGKPLKMVDQLQCRSEEDFSSLALMHKHKLPPGFVLTVIKGSEGMKFHLGLGEGWKFKLIGDENEKDSKCGIEKWIERIEALGPVLKIGNVEFYESSPSSLNWAFEEKSYFPDPKTLNATAYQGLLED